MQAVVILLVAAVPITAVPIAVVLFKGRVPLTMPLAGRKAPSSNLPDILVIARYPGPRSSHSYGFSGASLSRAHKSNQIESQFIGEDIRFKECC